MSTRPEPVTTPTGVRIVRIGRDQRRDRARKYKVLIDGTAKGVIGAGEEIVVAVAPGQHTARLTIDWLSSETVTVTVNPGQVVSLGCQPNGSSDSVVMDLLRGTFRRKPWIDLAPTSE